MGFAARLKTQYVCQNCGAVSPRWQGAATTAANGTR